MLRDQGITLKYMIAPQFAFILENIWCSKCEKCGEPDPMCDETFVKL